MSTLERIFQAILFESGAIALSLLLVEFVNQQSPSYTDSHTPKFLAMLISISVIAMVWTFIYNKIFDYYFQGDKLQRPIWLRVLHILGFEGGLLCFTLPLVMWVMKIGLWQAFLLDISLTLMVLVYGFVFYWLYDWIRAKIIR